MITLHIQAQVKPGREQEFERVYREVYTPAITRQRGFRECRLLRPYGQTGGYEIDIVFDSEALREQWVASPEHATAWPEVEGLCTAVLSQGFDILG